MRPLTALYILLLLLQALVSAQPKADAAAARLIIQGARIYAPSAPAVPILLRGFTLDYKLGSGYALPIKEDLALGSLLPNTTLVRLVMNHWHDTDSPSDCSSSDASSDYTRPECLAQFDAILNWTTSAKLPNAWSVITARSALAAGDGGPGNTVFTNVTLKNQWIAMWTGLAKRYASYERIAGYVSIQVLTRSSVSCGLVTRLGVHTGCFVGAGQGGRRERRERSHCIFPCVSLTSTPTSPPSPLPLSIPHPRPGTR